MTPKILYFKQGTQEWFDARAGKVTSSVAPSLFSRSQDKSERFGATARNHAMSLAVERITGKASPNKQFYSHATNRGNELEPKAREYYSLEKMVKVTECGFIDCGKYGTSPDALIDENGLLEIKCYSDAANLMKAALGKNKDHDLQIKWHIFCAQREYCDYLAYFPELEKRGVIKRYYADTLQNKLFENVLVEYEEYIESLIFKYNNSELVF